VGNMGGRSLVTAVFLAFSVIASAVLMTGQPDNCSIAPIRILTVPEDFVLTEVFTGYDFYGNLSVESRLVVSSNGTVSLVAEYYPYPGNDVNVSVDMGKTYIDYLRNAMNTDDLCIFNGTYNDAGTVVGQGPKKDIDELFIETPCGNRTMKFYGNAMLGILPYTYVALNNLWLKAVEPDSEPLNVTIDVSAHVNSNGILNVSAVVRNNASHTVSLSSVCETIWPAEIIGGNGCSIIRLPPTEWGCSCIVTVQPGETYAFDPKIWNASGLAQGRYVVAVNPSGLIGVAILDITQDLGHVNSPPDIFLNVADPINPDNHTYTFDASECCDEEDFSTDLEVRWDWHSDGVWDSEWTYDKVASHDFSDVSGYDVTIEVRDSEGLTAEATFSMTDHTTTSFTYTSLLIISIAVVAAVLVTVALVLIRRRK
jgi:hypothetical protein